MLSKVWAGSCPATQPYGCTDLAVEPFDLSCPQGHFHCGVDIGMAVGTPLKAARGGLVTYVGYGLLAIKVGDETDWYVHIDRVAPGISAFSGIPVQEGELVAYSGDKVPSGGSLTGPHLHFEVQTGNLNEPVTSRDPIPVLEGVEEHDMVFGIGPLPAGAIWAIGDSARHIGPNEWNKVWQRNEAGWVKPVPIPVDAATLAEIESGVVPAVGSFLFSGSFSGKSQ